MTPVEVDRNDHPEALYRRASRLIRLARGANEGDDEQIARERAGKAIAELEEQVTKLESAYGLYREFEIRGFDLPQLGWAKGLESLREHTTRGLPSPQAIVSARRAVGSTVSSADEVLRECWQRETRRLLGELQFANLAILAAEERTLAEIRRKELIQFQAKRSLTAGDVQGFFMTYEALRDTLSEVDAPGELRDLLQRMHELGGVAFADLDEVEIDAMRAHPEIARHIRLSHA